MATKDELKEAYFNGQNCYKNGDYKAARYWYQLALGHPSYHDLALLKFIQIDIKEGKYASARKLLEGNQSINSALYHQTYALLETIECNYSESQKHYRECMKDAEMQYKTLLVLAKMYMQLGDYEIAQKMLETLQLNDDYFINATFELTTLSILEKNYSKAQELLGKIPKDNLIPTFLSDYRVLDTYSSLGLGNLQSLPRNFDSNRDYALRRMFDKDDDGLYKHLEKHLNQDDKDTYGCFFKYIDMKKLVYDVKGRIENINANHFGTVDNYKLQLDTPIGFKGDIVTNDLCVITLLGTRKILTMYPVHLSQEFDKEGFCNDQKVMEKRIGGIRK